MRVVNHLNKTDSLISKHLADLAKSGIDELTANQCGIYTVLPKDFKRKLGRDPDDLQSAYAIPYPHTQGFERYRCFWSQSTGKKQPKYLQKKGTGNHLYIPPLVNLDLLQGDCNLIITEGEKKALSATLHGLPAVAIAGLWNWSDRNGGLCAGFELINFKRTFLIVPDSDYTEPKGHGYRKDLVLAVQRLSKALISRGATVQIVQLPKTVKGLDDYIVSLKGGNL